ncbi:MAG TPA: SDR family NAD(P)-dependent oxidoreductase [Xanthobacteraceae bacterium]|nr:SDR family NAD(P)-dependent oxidoreductase [Xanthobacteraceae bacterium]
MTAILITGGAGFIGVHSARHFAERGYSVTVLDNLSRKGAAENLSWLKGLCSVNFVRADIRDHGTVAQIVGDVQPDVLLHLAAQVAVTTSVEDPRTDFEANALGTFNLLEAVRLRSPKTFFIYAATNKVYGRMEDLSVVERGGRYEYGNLPNGVGEDRPLDFHSPYGCSKGVADQYTIDYSRIYGLQTVTFRQSCIYGTRQFGIEDQGWVAWFTIASVLGKQITIFGNGKQIRDVLHVGDLVRAYEAAYMHRDRASGQTFNIGGGPANTLSLQELIALLEQELDKVIPLKWSDWRPGDQPVFVCNVAKAERLFGWRPEIGVREGVNELIAWTRNNSALFAILELAVVRS